MRRQWQIVQSRPLSAWGTGAWQMRHELGVAPRWVASFGRGRLLCWGVCWWQTAQRLDDRGRWHEKQWNWKPESNCPLCESGSTVVWQWMQKVWRWHVWHDWRSMRAASPWVLFLKDTLCDRGCLCRWQASHPPLSWQTAHPASVMSLPLKRRSSP